jgi:hypothetical protein
MDLLLAQYSVDMVDGAKIDGSRLTDDRLLGLQRILALIVRVEGWAAMHVLVIMNFGIVN